eukprot:312362-Pelagomonas_calceolata.AAC.2
MAMRCKWLQSRHSVVCLREVNENSMQPRLLLQFELLQHDSMPLNEEAPGDALCSYPVTKSLSSLA